MMTAENKTGKGLDIAAHIDRAQIVALQEFIQSNLSNIKNFREKK